MLTNATRNPNSDPVSIATQSTSRHWRKLWRFTRRLAAVPAVTAFLLSFAGTSHADVYRPITNAWDLVFVDNFNDAKLDTSKWTPNWLNSSCMTCVTKAIQSDNELAAFDPAQVKESNGSVRLSMIDKPVTVSGVYYPYRSGIIQSSGKAEFVYGYFEARVFLPVSGTTNRIANWPAFWTAGHSWPTTGENDVLEGLSGGEPCYHFHSSKTNDGDCANGDYTGWHTYGSLWEPGKTTYYYDGVKVGQLTYGITSAPMYLILSYSVSNRHGGEERVPATMKVDYVKVWQKPN